ncbi:AMP-binding protein [Sulfidibacter corallicola]|uniref:AMP-binding protein n=1 Tax=Sulfidibacter corallicola TaxID=2818388 RepID=A0A8A4TLF3_SULCO|nr:AMP-binding protein [Sulfidibacter corallicola]QTD50034.1 AMP-binding protein [Sulfidibacter corallicola]
MWVDFLHRNAQRYPNRTALTLVERDHDVSYAELNTLAARCATWLSDRGVRAGDRVAMLAVNRLEHLTFFFGCTKLGAIFVPLNFRLAEPELRAQLHRLEPKVFLTAGFPAFAEESIDLDRLTLPDNADYRPHDVDHRDTLMILFTSGSTGEPKGVMLHAGMLLWNIFNTRTEWDLGPNDVSAAHAPFFHTGGYNVFTLPLLHAGGRLVLTEQFDAEHMVRLIESEGMTVFFGVPTMFDMMRRSKAFDRARFPQLRFMISGGAPCPLTLSAAWQTKGVHFRQGFGMTEVGPNCFAIDEETALNHPQSVGRPMCHSQVRLIDEQGREVGPNEPGELCIRGPHVCAGYWRDADTFRETCPDGFFRTGDLAMRDERGLFTIVGRKKDMYISGGENVFPGEVVRHLLALPGVHDAQVVAVPDTRWGEVGFAFLVADREMTLAELRTLLEPHLSRYKHPQHLRCLSEFPLLANGKVDRATLTAWAVEGVQHVG